MKNIIIFGAPGSGKGTYSDEIVNRYDLLTRDNSSPTT